MQFGNIFKLYNVNNLTQRLKYIVKIKTFDKIKRIPQNIITFSVYRKAKTTFYLWITWTVNIEYIILLYKFNFGVWVNLNLLLKLFLLYANSKF